MYLHLHLQGLQVLPIKTNEWPGDKYPYTITPSSENISYKWCTYAIASPSASYHGYYIYCVWLDKQWTHSNIISVWNEFENIFCFTSCCIVQLIRTTKTISLSKAKCFKSKIFSGIFHPLWVHSQHCWIIIQWDWDLEHNNKRGPLYNVIIYESLYHVSLVPAKLCSVLCAVCNNLDARFALQKWAHIYSDVTRCALHWSGSAKHTTQ